MAKTGKQILAAALAVLLLLTGCNSLSSQEGGTAGAKGRYVEESISPPGELLANLDAWLEDGTLTVLGWRLYDMTLTELVEWKLAEDGTWSETGTDFGGVNNAGYVYAASRTAPGEYRLVYELDEGDEPAYNFLYGTLKDGVLEELPFAIESPEYSKVTEDGGILAAYYYELRYYNASGALVYALSSEDRLYPGCFAYAGNTLAVGETGSVKLYDLDTGKQKTTLNIETGGGQGTVICPADESGDTWYCASAAGIYKLNADGVLNERIMDGSLTSLSLPTEQPVNFFQHDGEFLLVAEDYAFNNSFYRYRYDADMPSTPDTTLSVYSLENSPTLRLAANTYQRQNPSVQVVYEYGYTGEDAQTIDDVLKALNTRLVAGTGPDVVMMDGMPLDSYIQRGALRELTDLVDDSLRSEVYENLALPPLSDEGLYTIAARFTMPMLFAQPGDSAVFDTPETLVDYLAGQEVPLYGSDPEHFISSLYPLYAGRWLADDYTLHADTLGEDLRQLKRLVDMYAGYEIPDTEGMMSAGALLTGTLYPVMLAELRGTEELKFAYTNMVNGMPHELFALPNGQTPLFTPRVNLGISATSANTDLAMDFVRCVLSQEVQATGLDDGLPVNRQAMQQNYQFNGVYEYYEEQTGRLTAGSYGWSYDNPFTGEEDTAIVMMYWPDLDFFTSYAIWENASAPLWEDRVVLEILETECNAYLLGGKDLEACLQSLSGRLGLLSAENEK